jgi:hypothetical protein
MAFNLPYSTIGASMVVDFTASTQSVVAGATISFTDISSPTPTNWSWSISGAQSSTSQNPTFLFSSPGTFSISLLAGNSTAGGVKLKTNYILVSGALLLDTYPSARAAYGVHRLRSAYTGDAFIIRRSNDNATQSISYLSTGEVDESAITSFVGSNSAYIQTWFDQSGNNFDISQSTTTRQPRIVNTGTIDKVNGKVAPYFDGNDTLDRAAGDISIKDLRFANFVYQRPATVLNSDFGAIIATEYNDANGFWIGYLNGNSKRWQFWVKSSNNTSSTYDMVVDQQGIASINLEVGTNLSKRWIDTQLDATVTYSDLSGTSGSAFSVGGQGATDEYRWNGYIQDVIIWNVNFDNAERQAIETKQKTYFNF